ncbi:MAG: cob(I)yrinic acid a,c-diamide adenosyltransferase [Planctomycetota bacterium]|nr:cob(I)yrinic acid a,c-diamide adenosyltransferase [Planctomycetota bacterium]
MSQDETSGRVLLFTGDGKGKTTAAVGMGLRACGHGMRVLMLQFIKATPTGEISAARQLPSFEIVQTGRGFVPPPGHPQFEEHRRAAAAGVEQAAQAVTSGRYDLVILDEVCTAVSLSLLDEKRVAELAAKRPLAVTLVLTGRGATPGLMALADTVTEMRCLKHAYDSGRRAQKGVEF